MAEFRHTGDRLVHEGGVWNVVVGSFLDPDGESFTRDIVRSPGSVAVLPLMFDPEGVPSLSRRSFHCCRHAPLQNQPNRGIADVGDQGDS